MKHSNVNKSMPAIIAIVFVILLSSCRNSNTDFNIINLSAISDISQIDLSFLVDEIRYIPLETTDEIFHRSGTRG